MRPNLSIFLAMLLLSACSSDKSGSFESNGTPSLYKTPPGGEAQKQQALNTGSKYADEAGSKSSKSKNTVASGHKVITQGDVSIESKDIRNSRERLDEVLKHQGGYIDQEAFHNTDAGSDYLIGVRVSSGRFDAFMRELLDGKDRLLSKNISSRDITAEYTDVQLRLNTKKAYYARYTELLGKAHTIEEIMSIDEQMRALQEEIESSEGQLRYWDDQASYSTLWITFSSPQKLGEIAGSTFSDKAGESFSSGWDSVIGFVLGLARSWPLVLVLAGTLFVLRRKISWLRRSKKAEVK